MIYYYNDDADIQSTQEVVITTSYKVRSIFHMPKVFEDYEDAIDCYNAWLEENDCDFVQIFESTENGWDELC